VHLGVLADWVSGEATVLEPDKCDGWAWYPMEQLPEPLFEMTRLAVRALRSGQISFDAR
jgi:8-oxo-dGTP diphosphatase